MRIAAIVYIVLSIGANFFFGNRTSFVLAALSFPLLVWLVLRKRKGPGRKETEGSKTPAQ